MTRIDYASRHLSMREVDRLFDAAVFAFCIGKPLSRFISIHLDAGGVADRRRFISKFHKLAGEWLKARTGSPACYVWVLEKPVGGEQTYSRGFNAHILIHVPHNLHESFYRMEGKWIEASGAKLGRGVRRSSKIDCSGPGLAGAAYLREGLLGLMRYISKGIEPVSTCPYGIIAKPQGVITGKRSGYSESIGAKHCWKHQLITSGRLSIFMPYGNSRRRRFVALVCPELLGLPPLHEDDLRWK